MELREPHDVECSMSFPMFTFKTTGRHTRSISWDDAYDKVENDMSCKKLVGFMPGDGFIKDKPGIYAFVSGVRGNIEDRILYIGKAKKIRNRLRAHFLRQKYIVENIEQDGILLFEIYAWYIDKPELIERELIERLQPKYNIEFK